MAETQQQGHDYYYQDEEEAATTGCHNCLFKWFKNSHQEDNNLLNSGGNRETWIGKNLNKVKEASEVFAGPKWKNLMRKIGAYLKKLKKEKNINNQYDAHSYALNFEFDRKEDDLLLPAFSSRFAPPSSTLIDHKQSFVN
ncbi:NHL domain-containing protein [Euphorbia peplus]|nr:NHL domain-containing protein [Euphorbia peplus]